MKKKMIIGEDDDFEICDPVEESTERPLERAERSAEDHAKEERALGAIEDEHSGDSGEDEASKQKQNEGAEHGDPAAPRGRSWLAPPAAELQWLATLALFMIVCLLGVLVMCQHIQIVSLKEEIGARNHIVQHHPAATDTFGVTCEEILGNTVCSKGQSAFDWMLGHYTNYKAQIGWE